MYYIICRVWPTQNQMLVKEMGLGWEQMSYEIDIGHVTDGNDSGEMVGEMGKLGEKVDEKMI